MNIVTEKYTFDSEPILAFYFREEGGAVVRDLLKNIQSGTAEGYINVFNLTEIYYILSRKDPDAAEEKTKNLRLLGLKVVPVNDDGLWRETAKTKAKHALSIADAFAVATAQALNSKLVVGSDEEFKKLNIQLLCIRE